MNVDEFRRRLLSKGVYVSPKMTADEFAVQLRDDV
jgi:hypothetical protein